MEQWSNTMYPTADRAIYVVGRVPCESSCQLPHNREIPNVHETVKHVKAMQICC